MKKKQAAEPFDPKSLGIYAQAEFMVHEDPNNPGKVEERLVAMRLYTQKKRAVERSRPVGDVQHGSTADAGPRHRGGRGKDQGLEPW